MASAVGMAEGSVAEAPWSQMTPASRLAEGGSCVRSEAADSRSEALVVAPGNW